jgi:isochorismate synthase
VPTDEPCHPANVSRDGLQETLALALTRKLTFVAFRSPGESVVLWVQRRPGLLKIQANDHPTDRFVLAEFERASHEVLALVPDLRASGTFTAEMLSDCEGAPESSPPLPKELPSGHYVQQVEHALQVIASGQLRKVVLARTVHTPIAEPQLPELFLRAASRLTHALVVLLHTPQHGTWCGASPERSLVVQNGMYTIDSLAGTLPAATAPTNADAWGAKERAEQALVTAHVRAVLDAEGVAPAIQGPAVLFTGELAHLHSRFAFQAEAMDALYLARALHPTPAVGGSPTTKATAFISEHEGLGRGLYGGFWGPQYAQGNAQFYVNIRCLQNQGARSALYVGAGVVNGSSALAELAETAQKAELWPGLANAMRPAG